MKSLYSSPFKVYLCLGALALIGLICGFNLPISLFPNSSKPNLGAWIGYGNSTAKEFLNTYGEDIEEKVKSINLNGLEVENVEANYYNDGLMLEVDFKWGSNPDNAKTELENTLRSAVSHISSDVRDSLQVWPKGDAGGFIAVSFYSKKRTIKEMYKILDPMLSPGMAKIKDANEMMLYDPTKEEVVIKLRPEAMTRLGLVPSDVGQAVQVAMGSFSAGSVNVFEKYMKVELPAQVQGVDDLKNILIQSPSGVNVYLSQVANVVTQRNESRSRVFKTNGSDSLILYGSPKLGGNVKRMAEQTLEVVRAAEPNFPKDIKYKIVVDPSEFIRSSVKNVIHEVCLGAFLAVLILYIFVGSFKNTITAAIEIPLSMVLAFIMMKIFDINLNLISLGGLALSAGMNVDASVVVMENIFRHFKEFKGEMTSKIRLDIIIRAVKEVALPIFASTVASLVVFAPLAFTSDLTYAVLGDLAKAVVFSHGFSAFVAIILVPTIRLQLMKRIKPGELENHGSFAEGAIVKMENAYARALEWFITRRKVMWSVIGGLTLLVPLTIYLILPKLPKEIIGVPDTDMMTYDMNVSGVTNVMQMEHYMTETVSRFKKEFSDYFEYTFSSVNSGRGWTMARLKDKSQTTEVWRKMEDYLKNTPTTTFSVSPWNPSELPIPNPPQLKLSVKGGSTEDRIRVADEFRYYLKKADLFPNIWTEPGTHFNEKIRIRPKRDRWKELGNNVGFGISELAYISKIATDGAKLGKINYDQENVDLILKFGKNVIESKEDLEAYPFKINQKIVPLKALANVSIEKAQPDFYRVNGRDVISILGKSKKGQDAQVPGWREKSHALVDKWTAEEFDKLKLETKPTIIIEEAEVELNDALKQLGMAIGMSILLIFFTLLIQFGSFVDSLLVLVAIPLGILGVVVSLFVFKSTLSLNSALGVILLNGIAVANSIILVDFIKRLVKEGYLPLAAAVTAGRKRLRPILITSLTSILGMMPIAFGMGEGGKILQPLGISVSGGLWVSTLFTLFLVPALQVVYLQYKQARDPLAFAGQLEESIMGQNNQAESDPTPRKPKNDPTSEQTDEKRLQ